MTRDICDRLTTFGVDLAVDRLALNMDQVDEYKPPPNPAKVTDSRFDGYLRSYGSESWELDALEPRVLAGLVRERIEGLIDGDAWNTALGAESNSRSLLTAAADRWGELTGILEA